MLRPLTVFCLALLCVCILEVQAGSRIKFREPHNHKLSSEEHYENGEHNEEFDHAAFLGQDEAKRWKKLPPYEVKQQLKELFPKIDVNQDKNVSDQELYEWIEQHMRKHVLRGAGKKMKDLDTNKDGKVSWEEYKESKFPASMEEGLKPDVLKDLRLIQNRDKRRFDFVDTDNDGHLSREELTLFMHPEESKRMTSFIIQETLDMFDTNKDGKVSLSEYLGDESTRDSQNLKSLTRTFNIELDRNHDGFLDKREIQKWTLPGTDKDPIEIEAHHMMKMGDDNKDGFLQVDELVRHYREFAGSRVTKYGDLLKEEL